MSDYLRKYQAVHTSHTHDDFHQIILPITGKLELEIEGLGGDVNGRTIGIVTSGEKHAFRAKGKNNFLVLDIHNEKIDQNLEEVWARAIEEPFHSMSEALLSLTDYAAFCAQEKMPHNWLETWQQLFLTTLECDLVNDLPALPARIDKAIKYMQANMGSQVRNLDLANAACLSPARFYELFQHSTGISPQQYLTQCRLKMAKRLILQGESLSFVADEVGFSDQSSFGRAFQKAYGLSPGQWRKQESETKKS
ncbi:putative AraC family transcriptional regulator [Candidatus Terasakiella magnetica]|uniref:Putative AraC family transcriptional regulator n=1 Tax=Candidatus Terasakiella magnetica TaxID=1867952 RepID=A0A1C3RJL5_9PROT|nr:AraC family transcriptional regulator [Candidatus Terasakiella magnetica]SCA57484.1 putative AraC family transcriptional regulator [Candidatus Terasakiella magnetica]